MAMAEIQGVAHSSIKTHNRILLNKIPKKKNTYVQSSFLFSLFLLSRSTRIWPFGPSRTIFFSRSNSRWRIKQKNKPKIYTFLTNLPYIYFFALFFYLLLHRLAVRIRLPFYDVLQVIIVLLQAYYWEFRHHSTVCCCELADISYFRAEQPSSSSPSSSSLSWSWSTPSLSSSSLLLFEPQYPESKFHWKRIRNPVPGIRNPWSWIPIQVSLGFVSLRDFYALVTQGAEVTKSLETSATLVYGVTVTDRSRLLGSCHWLIQESDEEKDSPRKRVTTDCGPVMLLPLRVFLKKE